MVLPSLLREKPHRHAACSDASRQAMCSDGPLVVPLGSSFQNHLGCYFPVGGRLVLSCPKELSVCSPCFDFIALVFTRHCIRYLQVLCLLSIFPTRVKFRECRVFIPVPGVMVEPN